jgi:hypothetical protein
MTNRKGIAFFLSLALLLCFAVPGTLAIADSAVADNEDQFEIIVDDHESTGEELLIENIEEETVQNSEPVEPISSVRDTSATGVEESQESEADNTADVLISETVDAPELNIEDLPAEELPSKGAKHIEGCDDNCSSEDCTCSCHEMSLFERLMSCTSIEEIEAIFEEISEDELLVLTEEELAEVENHILVLEPEPLPAIVAEASEPPVQSEIVFPAVSFTNVAPLGDPVIGGAN